MRAEPRCDQCGNDLPNGVSYGLVLGPKAQGASGSSLADTGALSAASR